MLACLLSSDFIPLSRSLFVIFSDWRKKKEKEKKLQYLDRSSHCHYSRIDYSILRTTTMTD